MDKEEFQRVIAGILSQKNFPATGLIIAYWEPITDTDLKKSYVRKFFKTFGSRFTQVYLFHCILESKAGMAKLLEEYLPKVEVLAMRCVRYSDVTSVIIEDSEEELLMMPHVRRISFEKGHIFETMIMNRLILGSPNLRIIDGLHSYETLILDRLQNRDQLVLLGSLTLVEDRRGIPKIYQSLVLHPPNLTKLTLDVVPECSVSSEFEQCAKALLIGSRNTLKKLKIGRLDISWKDIPVVFTKLHTLKLGFYAAWRGDGHYYPNACIVSPGRHNLESVRKFPGLRKIGLLIQRKTYSSTLNEPVTVTQKILEEHFWEPATVWNTVESLELHNHFSPEGMRYLAQVFPNVTQVAVNFSHASQVTFDVAKRKPSDMWYVRKFRSLRKLIIKDFPDDCDNFQLESFLTGIPVSICEGLRNIPKQTFEAPLDRVMRPFGGLWKLRKTGLRELEISYSTCKMRPGEYPAISQATVWYGLEVIPELRTYVRVPAGAKPGLVQLLMNLRPQVLVEC